MPFITNRTLLFQDPAGNKNDTRCASPSTITLSGVMPVETITTARTNLFLTKVCLRNQDDDIESRSEPCPDACARPDS